MLSRIRSIPDLPVLAGLFVVALVVRLYTIADRSIWLDEAFSVWMAAQPLSSSIRDLIALDQHPPLYYTLLHFWTMLFGTSEASVRGMSALLGALTVPVMFLIGKRLGGLWLGWITALLFLFAPIHVAYAQDARMYPLLTFNAACAILCALMLLHDPAAASEPLRLRGPWTSTRRWWLGLIIFSTLVPLSHNTAILYYVVMALFVLLAFGLPKLWQKASGSDYSFGNWIRAGLASLLLWLPWLPGFLWQSYRVDQEFWITDPTKETIMRHWADLVNAYSVAEPALLIVVLIFAAMLLVACWYLRAQPRVLLLLLMLLFLPFVGEMLVGLRRPIFHTRTLIWTSLPLLILAAVGMRALSKLWLTIPVLLVVLLSYSASLNSYYQTGDREGWRDAAEWVAPMVQSGDMIMFNAGWVQIPFEYYYERVGPPIELRGMPADMFERGTLEPIMDYSDLPRLEELTDGRKRFWLVYSHNWYTDPRSLIPDYLKGSFTISERRSFEGLQVFLYTAR
jgi:mannosyltransferase